MLMPKTVNPSSINLAIKFNAFQSDSIKKDPTQTKKLEKDGKL